MDASIRPKGILDFLSQQEIRQLSDPQNGRLNELFRRCALAVLNSDSQTDSGKEMLASFPDFRIEVVQQTRSIKLELRNAPATSSLRKIFSGIVSGNIKEEGVLSIEKNGSFQITGDHKLMHEMDVLLSSFCRQQRMKLSRDTEYKPCYKISLREKRSESNRRK